MGKNPKIAAASSGAGARKRGRPPKSEEGKLSKTMYFRVRPALFAELENAANAQGRSISEECEHRLTVSVQRASAISEIFGSPSQRSFVLALSNAIRWAGERSDGPGQDEALQAQAAAIAVIEELTGMKAGEVLDKASETGLGWRDAARAAVSLEHAGAVARKKPLAEIVGR